MPLLLLRRRRPPREPFTASVLAELTSSPVGTAKPQTVKKDDDTYEMAIKYKKDEDFSGWYTDVSTLAHLPDYKLTGRF